MRKSIWILVLAAAALCVPTARADGFDASFTCTNSCIDVPTDPLVIFPSPTIPISFFSQTFTITLNSLDAPTDHYQWSVVLNGSVWSLLITDLTRGTSNGSSWFSWGSNPAPYGSGDMNFDSVSEPSSISLLLLGLGMLLVVQKFVRRGLPQAS